MIKPIVERIGDELKVNLFPKQAEFINSDVDDILFGGAASGGKSAALLVFSALRRMKYPGSNGLILRRTFAQLEKSLILRSRDIYPLFGATYNDTKKVWKFPNSSISTFGYLEKDADVYNYHSDEYHDISFDEASLFTEFQINYMTSRCRSTLPGCKALIRLASNPGNVGHAFLKKRYIEPSKMNKKWFDEITGKTYSFISAKINDNPAILELDPGYKDRLRVLGEQKYLALAEGNWDVHEGQYFDVDLRPGHGVLPYIRVPDSDSLKFISMDWGYAEPAAIYWWELLPSGRLIPYRELYVTKLSPKELAQRIVEMSPSSEKYEYIACPPEIWGKKVELEGGGQSIHDLMQSVFGDKIPMIQAPNARVPGWTKLREYLSIAGDGRPWMQISPACPNLIRTLPTMMHDEKNPEDCSDKAEDHACIVGETILSTRDGDKTIEELCGTEGEIWTQAGWKEYTGVQKTRSNADVFKFTLDSGETIFATEDHKFMTENGWVKMKDLTKGSQILIQSVTWKLKLFLQRFKSSTVCAITNAENIFRKKEYGCTVSYGNSMGEESTLTITSTIGMEIGTTTAFKISNFYWALNTWSTMLRICLPSKSREERNTFWIKPFRQPGLGTEQKKEKNGIAPTPRSYGVSESRLRKFASPVASLMQQGIAGIRDFAVSIAKCGYSASATVKGCVNTKEHIGKRDVFNLCVADVHSYFANNSFLVANCDSARYFVMTLQNIPRENSEIISPYERLFGISSQVNKNQSFLPPSGRGGYGR